MPRFEPFTGIRYGSDADHLDAVTAPPYDVLSERDVDELLARHPHNIVAIDVPREADGEGRYEAAAKRLGSWLADGVLVRDEVPSFTVYRMSFVDEAGVGRSTVGVIGALEVVDEGAGGVLPHERTTPKAKTDRLDLTRATSANLSPVWGLSLASGLSALLAEPGEAMGSVTSDGVTHTVERVSDPERVAAIEAAVGAEPVVIADGHHRYAISRTYRDEQRLAGGAGGAELTMTYIGELVEDQLSVEAIHRLYSDVDLDALVARLEGSFVFEEAGQVTAGFAREVVERAALCLVRADGSGVWMTPRPGAFPGVRDLDSSRLEQALAGFEHTVSYQHGVAHVVDAVAAGTAVAGVLIRPVSVAEIRRTADEGLLMPPKSTFFTPKLRTGLVVRPID
ncbi:MAG: DUF1015 domain-containing protein [Ilumatobacteraceae bacterium]